MGHDLTFRKRFDRLIDTFVDAQQRDRAVFVALVGYGVVWTLFGVIAKSNQDLHPDMAEMIAWSRNLAFGFPKHPPFAAIVVRGWFAWFPVTDWAFYLLAAVTATLALWIAWQLYADYLPPKKRLVALCFLTFIPFFNFHALKFNVNTVLIPLWAATTFFFLRSHRTGSAAYGALTGIAAAACMATKYWSIFLLVGLAAAALSDRRRGQYFRSPAPWIAILVGAVAISPHIGWLEKHNFSPFEYALTVHGDFSFTDALVAALRYCADAATFVSVPLAIVLVVLRPSRRALADIAWPADRERRLVAVAFWTTLLSPIVPALMWGLAINAIWTMSSWTLLPVLLLSPHSVEISSKWTRRILGSAVVLPLVILLAAPAVAVITHRVGNLPISAHSRLLSMRVDRAWHEITDQPLRYVDGDVAYSVALYAPDRPRPLPDLPPISDMVLKRDGLAFVCVYEDERCIGDLAARYHTEPDSRRSEVVLRREFFGQPGRPQRYAILIVPPHKGQK